MLIKDLAQGTIDDLGSVDRQLRGYEMAREDEEIVPGSIMFSSLTRSGF